MRDYSKDISIEIHLQVSLNLEYYVPSFQENPWEDLGMMTTLPRPPFSESPEGIS